MLLRRFFDAIKKILPDKYVKISPEQVARLNPDKITVENVRTILNTDYDNALDVCETAVKEGYFAKKIALYRPSGGVEHIYNEGEQIPPIITIHEEIDGHYEEEEISTENLRKSVIYSLAI